MVLRRDRSAWNEKRRKRYAEDEEYRERLKAERRAYYAAHREKENGRQRRRSWAKKLSDFWRRLARFYQDVFGCVPVPPERNLSGPEMEAGTGVPGARLRGMHLRLPGAGPDGPTLEIFEYSESAADVPHVVNRPGFAHIAFAVDSVAGAREQVLSRGGAPVGEIVTVTVSSTVQVTWCYVRDPEGNIVELQDTKDAKRL